MYNYPSDLHALQLPLRRTSFVGISILAILSIYCHDISRSGIYTSMVYMILLVGTILYSGIAQSWVSHTGKRVLELPQNVLGSFLALIHTLFGCVQMRSQLAAATAAAADAAAELAATREDSCTTDTSAVCAHNKAHKQNQVAQEQLQKQQQLTTAAERRADHFTRGMQDGPAAVVLYIAGLVLEIGAIYNLLFASISERRRRRQNVLAV